MDGMLNRVSGIAYSAAIVLVGLGAIGCAAMATTPVTGLISSDVAGPVGATGDSLGCNSVGRATAESIMGLVAYGDASIEAAARAGGITRIHHVDYESTNILGLYATFTTVVYGYGPHSGESVADSPSETASTTSIAVGSTEGPTARSAFEYNGSEWMVGPDRNTTWNQASEWAAGLDGGWRLPTPRELRSLYESGVELGSWGPFENGGMYVWTSESTGSTATNFNFKYGQERRNAKDYAEHGRAFAIRSL
jgi:hypothetical protein